MVLVTGGTGLVGSHLLYDLVQSGTNVRAIYRNSDKIASVRHVFSYFTEDVDQYFSRIEWVQGDILDIPSLQEHFQGITHVYHCAALVSFDPNDYYELRKVNIEGTANVVNTCLAHGIEKLCYVSSVAAIGDENPGIELTEESPWNPEADHNVYAITKYGAEMEVWRATQEGLNVVIVNPGIILGGGFWRSGSGSLFRRIHKGLSHYTLGKTGYVDIIDVVNTMKLLMESNIKNERYIVVSENWTFKDFSRMVAAELKVDAPQKLAKKWQLNLAWRLDWLRNFVKGKRRRLTKQTVRSISSDSIYSSKKLQDVLGYEFCPISDSIRQTSRLFLKDY